MLRLVVILAVLAAFNSGAQPGKTITTRSGLQYEIVAKGRGQAAKPGSQVRIHETTTLEDGTLIYSTRSKGSPLKFIVDPGIQTKQ
jgi:FKBP-type peptidyl-prolyl cis-trans isomerase